MAETKIILTQTVANLGHAGDVVEVRPGYARNYLFPQGLAFKWTKGAAAQIEAMKRARQAKALATREDAVAAKAAIEGTVVEIAAKVSESGKLFGAVDYNWVFGCAGFAVISQIAVGCAVPVNYFFTAGKHLTANCAGVAFIPVRSSYCAFNAAICAFFGVTYR